METVTLNIDYLGYVERPALLVNANNETLSFFVGERLVVPIACAHAVNLSAFDVESGEPALQAPGLPFLNWFVATVTCRDVLLSCFHAIESNVAAHHFMHFVISSPMVSRALIVDVFSNIEHVSNAVADLDVFNEGYAYRWLEYGILRRGNILLDGAPTRKFELSQLVPIMMSTQGRSLPAAYGVSRSIVGTALDGEQLRDESIAMLLLLFPNDQYFTVKLQRPVDGED
jgi:hypothetical protein